MFTKEYKIAGEKLDRLVELYNARNLRKKSLYQKGKIIVLKIGSKYQLKSAYEYF